MEGRRSSLRDRRLEAEVADLVAHDVRLRDLRVEVRVDGGVAHLEGWVPAAAELALLRDLLARLRDLYAVWDRVRVASQGPLKVVDVGAGGSKQYAANVGFDRVPTEAVDVVADLFALPLADRAVDRVFAVHVLEHLTDVVGAMNELHRVTAPGGVLHVMAPDRRHVNAYADPTHVRFLDVQTFKYFCTRRRGVCTWRPHLVTSDGASIFADLSPLAPGDPPATPGHLARFFD